MKTKTLNILINAHAQSVFTYMDNIGNTGMHMTKSSMPMMGSKLELQQLTKQQLGLHSKCRWYGSVLGFAMDFTVEVTKWVNGREKVWETVGNPQMIILSWYQMHLLLTQEGNKTKTELSIAYEKPNTFFFRIIAFFLAPWYAKWCLNNMLQDSKKHLEPMLNS